MTEHRSNEIRLALAGGMPVENRLQPTCPVPMNLLCAILPKIEGGPRQLKITIDVADILEPGNPGGIVNIVPRQADRKPLSIQRWGKKWRSSFLDVPKLEYSTLVTVILERRNHTYYSIGAAHWGEAKPPEPGDLNGLRREAERLCEETGEACGLAHSRVLDAARRFWEREFAFRLGCDSVCCSHCNVIKIEAEDVRAAVHGRRVLCIQCENEFL